MRLCTIRAMLTALTSTVGLENPIASRNVIGLFIICLCLQWKSIFHAPRKVFMRKPFLYELKIREYFTFFSI